MKIINIRNVLRNFIFKKKIRRNSLIGLLLHIRNAGFKPLTIIDVGAAQGNFTKACMDVYADAQYLLVEPLVENRPILEKLASSTRNISIFYGVISSVIGETTLFVHEHLDGSSIMNETDGEKANGIPRNVPSITLDKLITKYPHLKPPYLLKLDIQGAELEALKCGLCTLKNSEYVLMEVSFFKFFKNGPQFCDVIAFMKNNGFVPYDVTGLRYRPYDNALAQVDVAFVKEEGLFRKYHGYATIEQRSAIVEDFKRRFNKNKF